MKDRPTLVAFGLSLAFGLLALAMQAGRHAPRIVASPLHRAVERSDLAAIRRLLDAGVPVDGRTYAGQTGLGLAVVGHEWPAAELFLARGADSNAKVYGMSLLKVTALSADWKGYDWLLRHGARPDPGAAALRHKR